ncbi:hypothetical protein ACFO25_17285 [Paenactinomyces guangxiensis]|uniref:Uncharacterized protein n=1 Tax=Paenactinomyces guangxiensis TaxID=1490290 RepID=A0A7W1WRL2_9BACL|nr:hypothetical protein [Paenactinomyces guangxiensis]MBA4494781.1 hypothetical protein [Paenactinomyces guangxiensis]MBH8591865.1 hypothetical protein [Paenactinomyces guangxiensis]
MRFIAAIGWKIVRFLFSAFVMPKISKWVRTRGLAFIKSLVAPVQR